MPGNHPKERMEHSEHGESLKSRIFFLCSLLILLKTLNNLNCSIYDSFICSSFWQCSLKHETSDSVILLLDCEYKGGHILHEILDPLCYLCFCHSFLTKPLVKKKFIAHCYQLFLKSSWCFRVILHFL